MVLLMEPDRVGTVMGVTAMGNEGAQWLGMAPFVERPHAVQNLGDGTFFHSGQLAVQAAVASGANLTFKLLYNGTVAMTGGQDAVGGLDVPTLAGVLLAHGVADVLITTDDVTDYEGVTLPEGPRGRVQVWDRTRIVEAQERLAAVPGVTVLIHDQACAAQARRLRKRGGAAAPATRAVINTRICEGCGHCGQVSNCLSLQPLDTPFGRKTTIDQSSCNVDLSCLHGDCPSFMTVVAAPDQGVPAGGSKLRRAVAGGATRGLRVLGMRGRSGRESGTGGGARVGSARSHPPTDLPDPTPVVPVDQLAIRFAGIGGTGVVTIAQILGTAALLDGWHVRGLDQTGLSQKAGPVVSDLRLSRMGPPPSNLLGAGEADVLVAFDELAGASDKVLQGAAADRTVVVASTTATSTGSMVGHPERELPGPGALRARLEARSVGERDRWVDAGAVTRGLLGSSAAANVFLLGVALQAGCIPVDPRDVEEAIDLNGVAVEANLAALRWGRRWVLDSAGVEAEAGLGAEIEQHWQVRLPSDLADRVARLADGTELADLLALFADDLTRYQDRAAAEQYLDTVERVADAERAAVPGSTALSITVARMLHKLMAYKDEYEVARLMFAPEALAAAEAVGGPGATVAWRLHPPLLRSLGLDHKLEVPAWTAPAFRTLQRGKRLRGTPLDPFGRTPLRRLERQLPNEYRDAIEQLCRRLRPDNLDEAVAIAALPDQVRGYEDIKLARIGPYRQELAARLSGFGR
jgi:indolepyruvate ferredoxin oxidoreductase